MEQIFWFIYAAFLGTATVGFILHSGPLNFPVKFDLVVSVITWIGLFGFVTHNQIFDPIVWKFVFFGGLAWDIIFAFTLKKQFEHEREEVAGPTGTFFVVLSTALFLGPLYYGLFQYAF